MRWKLLGKLIYISLIIASFAACGNVPEDDLVALTDTQQPVATATEPAPESTAPPSTATREPDPTLEPIIPLIESVGLATDGLSAFENSDVSLQLNQPDEWIVAENIYQNSGLFTFGTEGALTVGVNELTDSSTVLTIVGDVDSMGLDVGVSVLEPAPLLEAYLLMTTQNRPLTTLLPVHNILVNDQVGAATQFSLENDAGETLLGQAATLIHEDRALFFYAISPEKVADTDIKQINAMLYSIELNSLVTTLAIEQENRVPQTTFPLDEIAEITVDGTQAQLLNLATTNEPIAIITNPQDGWLDLQLAVQDGNSDTILQVDSTFTGEPEAIVLMPDVNQQYMLSVQEFYGEQGDASLIVKPLSSMNIVAEGVAVTDQTDPSRHEFTAVPGQLYLLTAEPGDGESDLVIGLADAEGTIAERDNSDDGQAEFMLFGVTVEGQYEVVVSERSAAVTEYRLRVIDAGTSNYVLTVDEASEPPTAGNSSELLFGGMATGELAAGETADFQFAYSLDQDVLFIASGLNGEDLAVDVYDATGDAIITIDDTGEDTTETFLFPSVAESADYFLRVRNYDAELPAAFQIEALDVTNWRIAYDVEDVVETLEPDTEATYTIALTTDDVLFVRVEPETNEDIQIGISTSDETPVTLTDDSGTGDFETLLFKPSVDGEYTVSVFDYYGKAGGFTIDIGFLNEQ